MFTIEELIEQWKLRALLEPTRPGLETSRDDSAHIDNYLRCLIDNWYRELLAGGDTSLVEPQEIVSMLKPLTFTPANHWEGLLYRLPRGVYHVTEVSSTLWRRPAAVTPAGSALARRQLSPVLCGNSSHPVAVVDGDTLRIHAAEQSIPTSVMAIIDIPGSYFLTDKSLTTIPTSWQIP